MKEVVLNVSVHSHSICNANIAIAVFLLQIDGMNKLTFAAAYGFRNIQNLMQKLKQRRCKYQFVEVMACPSGK